MTHMRRRAPRPLATLALVVLISLTSAGCGSNAPSESGTVGSSNNINNTNAASNSGNDNTAREKAVSFAQCMRDNGVKEFPDPDASGELSIDGVVNGSSLDPSAPAWEKAIGACKDLQPSGFTGHERSAKQQESALAFAQCIRDNGVKDFPDPTPDAPLVDTNRIPSTNRSGGMSILNAAMRKCGESYADKLGLKGR